MDWPWTPMHGETRYNFVFHFWPTPTTRKKFYALLWVTALISYFTWASLSVAFPLRGPMPISQWTAKNKQPSNSWTSLWTAETNFSQLRGIFFAHTCVMLLFLPKWRSDRWHISTTFPWSRVAVSATPKYPLLASLATKTNLPVVVKFVLLRLKVLDGPLD